MSDYDIERATRDDLEDRLTDHALAEALAGKRPPDLTGIIVALARPKRLVTRRRALLALAATLLIALTAASLWPPIRSAREGARRASPANDIHQLVLGSHSYQVTTESLPTAIAPQSSAAVGEHGSIPGFEANLSLVTSEDGEKQSREIGYTVARPYYDARTKEVCYTVCKPVYESDRLHAPFQVFGRADENIEGPDQITNPPFGPQAAASLTMQVTPRIIVQEEEEEELLGANREELAPPTLREILDQPTELDVVEVPLAEAIAAFAQKHKVAIVLDHAGLADAEIHADTAVTWNLHDLPLKSALRHVLAEHELAFVVVGDTLLVTSMTKAGVALERRVFPLGDVILPIFDPENLPPDHGIGPGQSGDRYERIEENPYLRVQGNPLSTFSIDVDTASYAKVRRYLQQEGMLPPPDAVRIEELVNYFSYDYAPPDGDAPFAAHVEVAACPWQPRHRLARIGIQGRAIENENRPASNLVFLIDVSGSMEPDDKLPRVRRALRMLVEQLGENDRVAIVVYANATGLVLPSTPASQQETILSALESLEAGGSTNGGAGIQLAYATAAAHFIQGGANRVILCTDGDFNVGVTSDGELERLIEEQAAGGVFLSVLGFGMGNHNDAMLEKLADRGNGNHGYIDTEQEARKLLVEEMGGTLVTIAKDVKLQVEFNPQQVAAYRLIGYENRMLRSEDFDDDAKDAGEIGAGHAVTALYEIIPFGELPPASVPEAEPLRYQTPAGPSEAAQSGELLTLRIRYKDPDATESHEPLVFAVRDEGRAFGQASADFKFASAVASFGMLLRGSDYRGETSLDAVVEIAQEGIGADPHGYRAAFLDLVRQAKELAE